VVVVAVVVAVAVGAVVAVAVADAVVVAVAVAVGAVDAVVVAMIPNPAPCGGLAELIRRVGRGHVGWDHEVAGGTA